jgi:hypothetical protein
MPDDASPDDLARWLRALADEVERDPALAARVKATTVSDDVVPIPETPDVRQPEALTETPSLPQSLSAADPSPAPSEMTEEVPQEIDPLPQSTSEVAAPVVRHTRRSSRYGAPTVAGRAADLGSGTPDPFMIYDERGEDGLRQALATLRAGGLRAIIRAHKLDPQGTLAASATERKLIAAIVAAVKRRASAPDAAAKTRRSAASGKKHKMP